MASWQYIGFRDWNYGGGWNYLWTNGTDLAWCGSDNMDPSELSDIPHAYAEYNYGGLTDEYNGDVMAWINDIGAQRDTVYAMKERKGCL